MTRTPLLAALLACAPTSIASAQGSDLLRFSCAPTNDLFEVLSQGGYPVQRFDLPWDAVRAAELGDSVLILAQGYPAEPTRLDPEFFAEADRKQLKLFVEYPSLLPGVQVGEPVESHVERAVVSSEWFGERLEPLDLLSVNGLHYLPSDVERRRAHLVAARVAGFDRAIFGLPEEVHPLLFTAADESVLVAATQLSGFIDGRYAPQDHWAELWVGILDWLKPGLGDRELTWEPVVQPTYTRDAELPEGFERDALRRGLEWFRKSQMIVHPDMVDAIAEGVPARRLPEAPMGDGTLGSLEAVLSVLHEDGTQTIGTVRRGDCIAETAMALAFGGRLLDAPNYASIADNLLDYYFFTSDARKRERGDRENGNFGLVAWGISTHAWWKASYGDDNARQLLGALAVAALHGEGRWDEALMQCLLGNLRTTGRLGFRTDRIDVEQLDVRGWRSYFDASPVSYAPHFEAYLWACYLWAYEQTGDELFLDRAKTALTMTMEQHTDGWRWTNGLAQERARILLPLAWLVRVEDTPEHRAMLRQAADGLLALQTPDGAIAEELGLPGRGMFPPPGSNAAYGTNEASLIARDGDPATDLLYTTNFAFLGLHEAAAATGDADLRAAADRLAEFLCRIQVRSERVPMVDGGWFRAFDFERWEHWGSNADHGWGAWSIESGWTQGWICAVLALRQMETSLWDLTSGSEIERHHAAYREWMLPPVAARAPIDHDGVGASVIHANAPHANYPDDGTDLTNGHLGGTYYLDSEWVGWLGDDAEFTVDLGSERRLNSLSLNCLQSPGLGIHLPTGVELWGSLDGEGFTELGRAEADATESDPAERSVAYRWTAELVDARYLRVRVTNRAIIPEGQPAAGSAAWIFADELIVNPRP